MFVLNHLQVQHLAWLSAADFFFFSPPVVLKIFCLKRNLYIVDMPHDVCLISPKGLFRSVLKTSLQSTDSLIY